MGRGGWFPKGGGQVLAAGFAEVIQKHDGQIRSRVEVSRIALEGGRVAGVVLSTGETIAAPVVISNIDIKKTYRDLIGKENLPRATRLQVATWRMAPPVINAFFGIDHDVSNAPNSNHFVIPNWDRARNLHALATMKSDLLVGRRRSVHDWVSDYAANIPAYVQTSTRRDPSHGASAPQGSAAFEAQTMAPSNPRLWGLDPEEIADGRYRRNPRYQEIKEKVTDAMLARIEVAYPGASAKVEWAELATPMTQSRYTDSTAGNAMGLEPRIGQYGFGRPRSATVVPGLFVAGTSTAWGPGTQGAMVSGVKAAGAVLQRDLVRDIRAGRVMVDRSRLAPWNAGFDPLEATRMVGRDRSRSR
ncbi:phytoene desaturase family protein [Tsukamurella soli]|uniref:phytoene desaturase family protein n=1 Tax=Tsukamurella soli TaxID=644556 RepID=UPI0031EBC792